MITKDCFCDILNNVKVWMKQASVLTQIFNLPENHDFLGFPNAILAALVKECEEVPENQYGWTPIILDYIGRYNWGENYPENKCLAVVDKTTYCPTTAEELYDVLSLVYKEKYSK